MVSSGHTSNNHSEYFRGWNSMSQIETCQSVWRGAMLTFLKDKDKADDLNVRGNALHGCIFPCQEVNWFIVILDLPSVIRRLHEMCANGIACICFILAFGLVVLRFTNVNWYAQLICSKIMITEIVEGPYSINNIDLYSNYSGNNIVSLNLSFLVLTCKAILWQKSNLSNRKDSCSMFIMNLRHCLNLRFTFLFASS